MILFDWDKYPNFRPDSPYDNWGDPNMIRELLVATLQDARTYAGVPIYVNRAYDLNAGEGSKHPEGIAADIRCPRLSLFGLFTVVIRFTAFRGVGVCADWNPRPGGLHVDVRLLPLINSPRALWGWRDGMQVPLDIGCFSPQGSFW